MNKNIDKKLLSEFEYAISYQIGKNYRKGVLGKARLRWKLTKVWKAQFFKAGIPGIVREQLGEEEATRLYQAISDKIINSPVLLKLAVDEYKTQSMFRTD